MRKELFLAIVAKSFDARASGLRFTVLAKAVTVISRRASNFDMPRSEMMLLNRFLD